MSCTSPFPLAWPLAAVTTRLGAFCRVQPRRGLACRLRAWPIAWSPSYRALPLLPHGQPCGRQLHAGPGMAAAAPCCAQAAASHGAAHAHRHRAAPLPSRHLDRCSAHPLPLNPPTSPYSRRCRIACHVAMSRCCCTWQHVGTSLWLYPSTNRHASCPSLMRSCPCPTVPHEPLSLMETTSRCGTRRRSHKYTVNWAL
jgi:hypothetical protein